MRIRYDLFNHETLRRWLSCCADKSSFSWNRIYHTILVLLCSTFQAQQPSCSSSSADPRPWPRVIGNILSSIPIVWRYYHKSSSNISCSCKGTDWSRSLPFFSNPILRFLLSAILHRKKLQPLQYASLNCRNSFITRGQDITTSVLPQQKTWAIKSRFLRNAKRRANPLSTWPWQIVFYQQLVLILPRDLTWTQTPCAIFVFYGKRI